MSFSHSSRFETNPHSTNIAGFLDWLTLGVVSGTWQGYQERYQELLNDPTLYNFVNYLTNGTIFSMVAYIIILVASIKILREKKKGAKMDG